MSFEPQTISTQEGRVNGASAVAAQLKNTIKGRVMTPQDPDYDAARTLFVGGMDRRPAVIARPVDAEDVARIIALARETGLELAIRSGGHSGAGHSVCDGGIVLDLAAMKGMQFDLENGTMWAEAGLTAGEVTAAAAAHGLAVGFGDTGSVGIGGITLGGGVGYLTRKYGLTIDNLLAAEIVTAEGQLLYVDDNSHPDLFWAIRGGGGNFGVVTRFKFRLHNVDTIVGGMLVLPATPDLIRAFVSEAAAAPEALTTIANVMTAPPMPFLPADLVGKPVILAMMAYAGDVAAGQQAIAPFRALAVPLADMIQPMPYAQMYPPDEEEYHPIGASRNLFMDEIDEEAARRMVAYLETSTAMMAVVQIRVLGGAMARVPVDATAFAHRQRCIMVNVAALVESPDQMVVHEARVREVAAALQQGPGAYVNFVADEGTARVRESYPGATWERLVAVKTRYDPTNLFRLNHNIPPATR